MPGGCTPPLLKESTCALELKLRVFGNVWGLVFGSWGEVSDDVTWLLNQVADADSYRHRSAIQAATPADAAGMRSPL